VDDDGGSAHRRFQPVVRPSQPIGNINIGSVGNGQLGAIAGAGSNGRSSLTTSHATCSPSPTPFRSSRAFIRSSGRMVSEGRVQRQRRRSEKRCCQLYRSPALHAGKATQVVATLNPIEIGWRQTAGAWFAEDSSRFAPTYTHTGHTARVQQRLELRRAWRRIRS